MKLRVFCTIVPVVLLSAHAVHAESVSARAQALFDQGLELAKKNRFKDACPLFRASQDLEPRSGTGFNLGVCYEKTYRLASAWAIFRESEGLARREGNAEREQLAYGKVEALEPQLVYLTVNVPSPSRQSGLKVTRDGVPVSQAEWGIKVPVDHGKHQVNVDAPGRWPWQREIEVATNTVVNVPVLHEKSWWTTGRKVGASVAAAGGATLITGLVLGLVANAKYNEVLDRNGCDADGSRCIAGSDANAQTQGARDFAAVSTALTISGVALAAGGGALILLTPPRRPQERALSIHTGPAWLGVSGSF